MKSMEALDLKQLEMVIGGVDTDASVLTQQEDKNTSGGIALNLHLVGQFIPWSTFMCSIADMLKG